MSCPRSIVVAFLAASLAGLPSGQHALGSGSAASDLPRDLPPPAVSVLTVQNLHPEAPTTVELEFRRHAASGAPAGAPVRITRGPLGPGQAVFLRAGDLDLPAGAYSVAVSAARPVGVVTESGWPATGAFTAMRDAPAARELVVPLVLKAVGGRSSVVALQNTDQASGTVVQIELVPYGQPTSRQRHDVNLAAGASRLLDLEGPDLATVPAGFRGFLHARSGAPIAIQTLVHGADAGGAYDMAGIPVTPAAQALHAPAFFSRVHNFGLTVSSTFAAVNAGAEPGDITVTYHGDAQPGCADVSVRMPPIRLAGGDGTFVYPGGAGSGDLPTDCFAAATIESVGGPVVAGVVTSQDFGNAGLKAHVAVSDHALATRLGLPSWKRDVAGRATEITVMRTDAMTATVTLALVRQDGEPASCGAACTVTIPAGGRRTFTFRPDAIGLAGSGEWLGSAIVSSDRPVAVVADDVPSATGLPLYGEAHYVGVPADERAVPGTRWVPLFFANRSPAARLFLPSAGRS